MCIKKNFKKTCVATQLFTLQVQLEIEKKNRKIQLQQKILGAQMPAIKMQSCK